MGAQTDTWVAGQECSMHVSMWLHLQNAVFDIAAQGVNVASVVGSEQQVVADCHCRAAGLPE